MLASSVLYRRLLILSAMLGIGFGWMISLDTRMSLSPTESYTAWVTYDAMIPPQTPRETLRYIRDSLHNTWIQAREDSIFGLYYVVMDGWLLIAGRSEISLRLPFTLMTLLVIAIVARIAGRWLRNVMGLVTIMIAVGSSIILLMQWDTLTGTHSDWRTQAQTISHNRNITDPAILNFAPDTALTYYGQRTAITDGMTVRINWQPFSPQEISAIGNRLSDVPVVWALLDMASDRSWDMLAHLAEGRSISYRSALDGIIAYQLSNDPSDNLSLTFEAGSGTIARYRDVYQRHTNTVDCFMIPLEIITTTPESYQMRLISMRLEGTHISEDVQPLNANSEWCPDIAEDQVAYLRLAIEDVNDNQSTIVSETNHEWGHFVGIGVIVPADDS